MPKIQTTAQRRYRYEMIAKAMGEQCVWHKMKMGNVRRGPPHYKLVINHIDDDQTNWAWNNLDLLCYSCNERLPLILTLHDRVSQLQAIGDQLERERYRENLPTWNTVLKDDISSNSYTPEIRLHNFYYPRWVKYVHEVLTSQGSMTKKELILNAAKKVGCSKLTSTNYYEVEAASLEGILTEAPDTDGIMVVQFAYHNNHEDRGNGHKPHEKLKETVALVETEAKG